MLRRDSAMSVSICDGFRQRNFFHVGRGLLPLLAVMLLAAPQLAFAQDSLAVTVNPRTLTVVEEASNTYTVKLDTEPSEDVVITVGGTTADLTVDPTSLTFTTTDFARAQTVTVTAGDDINGVDETVTLTHTAMIGDDEDEVALRRATVTVTVDDNDPKLVTLSTNAVTVGEASETSGSYTVVLSTEPTATVTVDIAGASGEITVSPSRLFFTAGDYNTPQTVSVFAGEDFDAENDTATLTHTVRGGDYTGVQANSQAARTADPPRVDSTVVVTVTDNDTRGVTVAPITLNVAAGARGTFSIVLNTQPTGSVRITVTEAADDFSVSPSRLSFSSSNWNRPQTVTVRPESDFDTANPTVILKNAIDISSSSRDQSYGTDESDADTVVADVTVTVSASEPAVRLSRSSVTIDEGKDAKYTVRLAANPGEDASEDVTVTAGSGFTVDPTSLTFAGPTSDGDAATWSTAQTVTVTGPVDDNAVAETVTITHTIRGAIVGNGILRATIRESDRKGVTISRTSLEVTEGGTQAYSVLLDSQPVGDAEHRVTVTIGGVSGDVTVDPSLLIFTDGNWSTAQTVEVTAATDDDGVTDAPVTLTHTVRGGDYDRQPAASVRVTIKEIHERGIIVDTTLAPDEDPDVATSSLPVREGMTGMYSVRLESQPTGTVTVMVRGASGDVTVKPSRLIFTTGNWDEEQTVEVKVGQDDDADSDPAVTLTHVASGGGYSVTSGMVTVTITDDDQARKGVIVTPTAFTVTEGGASARYTVVLGSEPTGTVTITLGGLAAAKTQSLVVNPTFLTFNRGNWNRPQPVTVTAAEDDDATGTIVNTPVVLTHAVSGGGYDSEVASGVSVTIIDNDTAAIIVSTPSIEMAQGTRRTYTVALGSRPTADANNDNVIDDVEVAISEPGGNVTVSPRPLTFTRDNWSSPRTVTVHAASNADAGTDTLAHTATDYTTANVMLTVKSSTDPGVAINPTSLEVTEDSSESYTVVLTSEPTATVRVAVAGATGDVRVNGRTTITLSFSTSTWDREQTVRVSLVDDADAVQDAAVTLTHTASGANYEMGVTISPVQVTLKENDKRGVTVSPTSLTVAAGSSGTYRIGLTSEPLDSVTVTVESPSAGVTATGPSTGSSLVFTRDNWNTDQTVTVEVAADAGTDEGQSFTLTHTVTGGDYSGVAVPNVTLTVPVEGAPSAPRGLRATAGDQSVTLTWGAPADNGGSAITRYEVRYQEVDGSYGEWATVAGGATATSTTVGNLENGKSYEFQVRARNAAAPGQPAMASATLVESAPGAPANLTATGRDGQVALSWGAPVDGGSQILRYEYRYAAAGVAYDDAWSTVSGAGNARRHTETGLTNGTEYRFQVRAVNSVGEGTAAEARATPGRAPSAPTGLTARVESETITLMWGMAADNGGSAITGYQVRYRMDGGQWSNRMTVDGGANATSHTITGLTNGIGHEIEVRAVNGFGAGSAASVEATPMEGIDFAHFANGKSGEMTNISDLVLVNVETSTVNAAIYFYGKNGHIIPADSLVDMTGDMEPAEDGGVTVAIEGLGEMTVSTNGEGEFVTGSVKVFSTGRIGGVLRYDISMIGVAGVGASAPVSDAIFPVRRMEGGINTGVAIRNLGSAPTEVTCHLMQGGRRLGDPVSGELPADGQIALFIDQLFRTANTSDFSGSVRCMAAEGGMFTAVALEMDSANQIFTTLPVVPVDAAAADDGESVLNFAHFANGDFSGNPIISDLVFVNVANTAVAPVIYFYDQDGNMIDADTVVDAMMEGVDFAEDGALTVMDQIPPLGEMTISTSVMGDDVVGSVRVDSDGPIGGVLRFVTSNIGVAGVGASEAVNAAIFPARYMEGGINTGAAVRNLESETMTVTCKLMQGGQMMAEKPIILEGNAQNSQFITEVFEEAFMAPGMSEFEGSVHCAAPEGMMFTGVALEMDFINRVFTTLPVVPVR